GEINLTLNGINEFKDQAEKSKLYFEKRHQKITSIKHTEDKTEIEIDYFAVLGIDFPNGLNKGQKLELKEKTIFTFKNNKIISIKHTEYKTENEIEYVAVIGIDYINGIKK